jgi:hypothetical protein
MNATHTNVPINFTVQYILHKTSIININYNETPTYLFWGKAVDLAITIKILKEENLTFGIIVIQH